MKTTTNILAICLIVFGLASCGGSDENTQDALDKLEEMSEDLDKMDENEDEEDEEEDMDEEDESDASAEWDEVLNDYEEYVDDYVAIIKKQKADPTDMSIMTEYTELMQKGTEWSTKMSEISSEFGPEQLTRMQEIQAKLSKAAF